MACGGGNLALNVGPDRLGLIDPQQIAVLDVIETEALQSNALTVGNYLKERVLQMAERHEVIGDVRGTGLFLAIDLVDDRASRQAATGRARTLVNGLKDNGVLTSVIGPRANVIKLRPPMVLSESDADFFLDRFDRTLAGI